MHIHKHIHKIEEIEIDKSSYRYCNIGASILVASCHH